MVTGRDRTTPVRRTTPARATRVVSRVAGAGDCYPAAEVVYRASGGKRSGLTPVQIKHEGQSHWFVRDEHGEVYDPTAWQFETLPPYEEGVGRGKLSSELRAERLEDLDVALGHLDEGHGGVMRASVRALMSYVRWVRDQHPINPGFHGVLDQVLAYAEDAIERTRQPSESTMNLLVFIRDRIGPWAVGEAS
jgi:hypothetical protein